MSAPIVLDTSSVITLTYKGQPVWPARHIGDLAGYSDGGKRFADKVANDWSRRGDLEEGVDFFRIPSSEYDNLAFASPNESGGTESVPLNNRGFTALTESGVYAALALSRTDAGRKLLRFWTRDVMPQIRATGTFDPAAGMFFDGPMQEIRSVAMQWDSDVVRVAEGDRVWVVAESLGPKLEERILGEWAPHFAGTHSLRRLQGHSLRRVQHAISAQRGPRWLITRDALLLLSGEAESIAMRLLNRSSPLPLCHVNPAPTPPEPLSPRRAPPRPARARELRLAAKEAARLARLLPEPARTRLAERAAEAHMMVLDALTAD